MNIQAKDRDALAKDPDNPMLQPTALGCAVVECWGIYGSPEVLLKSFVEQAFYTVDQEKERKRLTAYYAQFKRYPSSSSAGIAGAARQSVPPHVMFAVPVRRRYAIYDKSAPIYSEDTTGPSFAAFLRANALGDVIETAPKYNYASDVVVYVWSPDWVALKAFAKGQGWLSKDAAAPAPWEANLSGGPSAASE